MVTSLFLAVPLRDAKVDETMQVVQYLSERFATVPAGPWSDPTGQKRMIGLPIDITDRKEAEAALARSEERLALSVGAADLGTFCFHR